MEKYGFIYIWRDRKLDRLYVGAHWGTEDDSYICSSARMKIQYKKRPQDFKRRIIKKINTNRKEMFIEEQRWLDMIKPEELGVRYYNKCTDWEHWSSDEHKTKAIRQVNSNISKSLHNDPEYRAKYEKGLKKRVTTNWTNPTARGIKIAETKRRRFQEKRDKGLPCFEGQAAENIRIANQIKARKRTKKEKSRIGRLGAIARWKS